MRFSCPLAILVACATAPFVILACDDGATAPPGKLVTPTSTVPTVTSPNPVGPPVSTIPVVPGTTTSSPDAGDPGTPGLIATSRSAANQVDLVGAGDKSVTPDGTVDGTIEARLSGPIDGLILITTDADGKAAGGQQWDTLVDEDAMPASEVGPGYAIGNQTWLLGVQEGQTLINDADGRVAIPSGVHNLTLVASPSGFFNAGQYFRLYSRNQTTGVWTAGPNFMW